MIFLRGAKQVTMNTHEAPLHGLVGGIMKYFRMSYEEVVFRRSYINLILLNAAIPGIKPLDEEENETENQHNSQQKPSKNYITNDNGNSFFSSLM